MNERIKLFELFAANHTLSFKQIYDNKIVFCHGLKCKDCNLMAYCNRKKRILTNEDIKYIRSNYPEYFV